MSSPTANSPARLDAAFYLGLTELLMERFDDAIRHLERGVVVSRATGQGHLLVSMMLGQVSALAMRGRLAEAGELLAAADSPAVPVVQCYELLTRAELALGNLEAAKEWSRRADTAIHGLALPVTTGPGTPSGWPSSLVGYRPSG